MSTAVEITVSLKDSRTNPPKLKLKDSEGGTRNDDKLTSEVDAGATVTWIPDLSSGISQLTSVTKNTKVTKKNYNLLNGDAVEQSNGNFVGTIVTPSPGKGKGENYTIGFKIDGDDNTYYSDPQLKMKN
jgi:hypothetical protein